MFENYNMWTTLNRFSGYQSGLARHGFDKKLPTFLDVSVKLLTILIPETPKIYFLLHIFWGKKYKSKDPIWPKESRTLSRTRSFERVNNIATFFVTIKFTQYSLVKSGWFKKNNLHHPWHHFEIVATEVSFVFFFLSSLSKPWGSSASCTKVSIYCFYSFQT